MTLSQERLKELLDYDPETGVFRWRVRTNGRICVGDIAGSVHIKGHRYIGVDRGLYFAHRLAWLYMTGQWPLDQIDHKNTLPDDNRWENLRLATRSQNIANARKLKRGGTSRFKGVYWIKADRKWSAQIRVRGKLIILGRFNDEQAAHEAYMKAATKYFGDFARAA